MNSKVPSRLMVLAGLGVLIGVLAWQPLRDLVRPPASSSPHGLVLPPAPPAVAPTPPVDPLEQARKRAQASAESRLDAADKASEEALAEHLKALDRFFDDAKQNSRAFAADALGWGSKWRLIADHLPFTRNDRHQEFLRDKFEEHFFSPEQLEAVVRQVVRSYLDHLQSIESQALVDLQADLSDQPRLLDIQSLDPSQLEEAFRKALSLAQEHTSSDLKADVGQQVVGIIVGEVLTQVAVRMGVSAGILGAGAGSGVATLGVGIVVGLIVDQLVSLVWDWLADPKGHLADELDEKLDELHDLIVTGDNDHQGLQGQLKKCAQERSKLRRQAVLDLIQSSGGIHEQLH
jgi:hypothetical protein